MNQANKFGSGKQSVLSGGHFEGFAGKYYKKKDKNLWISMPKMNIFKHELLKIVDRANFLAVDISLGTKL